MVEKHVGRFFFIEIFDEIFFDQKYFRSKNIFNQKTSSKISMKNNSTKKNRPTKNFDQKNRPNVFGFFRRNIFRPEIFGLPIPIPNFPKIPKIALRKLCDEACTLPGKELILLPRRGYCVGGFKNRCSSVRKSVCHVTKSADRLNQDLFCDQLRR